MRTAIILHGKPDREEYYSDKYPSASNSHWIPWLQKQLLINNISTSTPEMYEAYLPNYKIWKKEFEKNAIDENSILIGHSCGGGFLIRWLSENSNINASKLILVAPWLDPVNETKGFFDFKIDSNLKSRTNKIVIFSSSDDSENIKQSIDIIKENIKDIKIREFRNYGHFCYSDLQTEKFPELLEEILN